MVNNYSIEIKACSLECVQNHDNEWLKSYRSTALAKILLQTGLIILNFPTLNAFLFLRSKTDTKSLALLWITDFSCYYRFLKFLSNYFYTFSQFLHFLHSKHCGVLKISIKEPFHYSIVKPRTNSFFFTSFYWKQLQMGALFMLHHPIAIYVPLNTSRTILVSLYGQL